MGTLRKVLECWTESKRVIDGEVKVTTCCCAGPGATAKECAAAYSPPHKSPCRCFCHSKQHARSTWEKPTSEYLWSEINKESK